MILQSVNRATKNVVVGKSCTHIYTWEFLKLQLVLILSGQGVVQMHLILQRKWPKCKIDGLRSPAFCVKQLLPCLVLGPFHFENGHLHHSSWCVGGFSHNSKGKCCLWTSHCKHVIAWFERRDRQKIFRTWFLPEPTPLMIGFHGSGCIAVWRSGWQKWWWPCIFCMSACLLIGQ